MTPSRVYLASLRTMDLVSKCSLGCPLSEKWCYHERFWNRLTHLLKTKWLPQNTLKNSLIWGTHSTYHTALDTMSRTSKYSQKHPLLERNMFFKEDVGINNLICMEQNGRSNTREKKNKKTFTSRNLIYISEYFKSLHYGSQVWGVQKYTLFTTNLTFLSWF